MLESAGGRVPRAWAGVLMLALVNAGCQYLPAGQEQKQASEIIGGLPDVMMATVSCGATVLASDELCAEVIMKDGSKLRFEHLGFNSFGSFAVNVVLAQAGGLVPRVASCAGVAPPNFHREAPLGHHFHPTLIDVKEAIARHRELLEEVEFWPQCPQFWEVQDKRGRNYRYCARRADATGEPPRPAGCQSSDSTK